MRRLLVPVALLVALATAAPASARVANPADRLAYLPADPEVYDVATRCGRAPQPGALALASWLAANVRGSSWGIMRCSKLSERTFSLHAEGRALDWHLDVRAAADRRAARRLIGLLLATDRRGTPRALARRMGVQEVIWDCRAWYAGSPRLLPYRPCFDSAGHPRPIDATTAHRDHVHLGLNRAGARLRTSFWARPR